MNGPRVMEVRLKQQLPIPGANSARFVADEKWSIRVEGGFVAITKRAETEEQVTSQTFMVPLNEVLMLQCEAAIESKGAMKRQRKAMPVEPVLSAATEEAAP